MGADGLWPKLLVARNFGPDFHVNLPFTHSFPYPREPAFKRLLPPTPLISIETNTFTPIDPPLLAAEMHSLTFNPVAKVCKGGGEPEILDS